MKLVIVIVVVLLLLSWLVGGVLRYRTLKKGSSTLRKTLTTGESPFGIPHAPIAEIARKVAAQPMDAILAESRSIAPRLTRILKDAGNELRPGITTLEVHDFVLARLRESGFEPAMAGYNGFPAAAAISLNDQLVHGIPSSRQIQDGDIVTIETSGATERAFASQGWTFPVGEIDKGTKALLEASRRALQKAIDKTRVGARTGDVSAAIQGTLEAAGFSVVREYIGYGMGQERVQLPALPGWGEEGKGPKLEVGQILNIQVLATAGRWATKVGKDGWTVSTRDGKPSAVVNAMVAVGRKKAELLSGFPD